MHAIIDIDRTTGLCQHAEIEVGSFRRIELSVCPHASGDLCRTAPERVERVESVSPAERRQICNRNHARMIACALAAH